MPAEIDRLIASASLPGLQAANDALQSEEAVAFFDAARAASETLSQGSVAGTGLRNLLSILSVTTRMIADELQAAQAIVEAPAEGES